MSEAEYRRPVHRHVHATLTALDREFLTEARCFFGGGTRIVMELGEYRESRDVGFLCSDRNGYRMLRETVTGESLGQVVKSGLILAREVRADQYGIRTFIESGGIRLKFEVVREVRIDLGGEEIEGIPLMCLARRHCFAEKFLANADRGLDASTLSRDIVDIAFMIEGWSIEDARAGFAIAETAYGESVRRALATAVNRIRKDRPYRNRCVDGLAITDPRVMTVGLKTLASFG
jgi:hypothetical protein